MKNYLISILAVGALALTGCSTVKTHVDNGPIAAKTFSFVNTAGRASSGYTLNQPQVHAMIQQAITKDLAAKGVNYVASGGDVTVAYLVIAGNNASTTSLNDYFGYSKDTSALIDKIHTEQAIKSKDRGYFEEGTLVIDFVNPQSSKLLKRSSLQSPILRNVSAEARQEHIQSLVDQTLGDLRIAP